MMRGSDYRKRRSCLFLTSATSCISARIAFKDAVRALRVGFLRQCPERLVRTKLLQGPHDHHFLRGARIAEKDRA
jgi:hypothetical protein